MKVKVLNAYTLHRKNALAKAIIAALLIPIYIICHIFCFYKTQVHFPFYPQIKKKFAQAKTLRGGAITKWTPQTAIDTGELSII